MMEKSRPVLLLRIESQKDENQFFPPYGLLYISASLENIGVDSKIFHDYESDELFNQILSYIQDNNPIWIGFSVITNKGLMSSLNLTRIIKEKFPKIPIVWGGIHPTLSSEQTLREKSIDYIIINEGEIVAQNLTKELMKNSRKNLSKINGLGYKENEAVIINPAGPFVKDLDQFKIDFEKIDVKRYFVNNIRWKGNHFPMITSRGCPFPCKFCYNTIVNKQTWRAHNAEYVKKQIDYLNRNYKIKNFGFYDDNFFVNRERGLEIVKYVPGQWSAELRSNYFTEDFIKKIKESRCNLTFIGAESGSERVLKEVINKCATKADLNNAIKISKKYHLNIGLSFIIGFPGETRKEMFETLGYIYKISKDYPSVNIGLYIFKAFPGTPLYYEAIKQGLEKTESLEDWADEKYDLEHANNPWIENQKELENIREIFCLFILLNKKRNNLTDLIRILSLFEKLRIKLEFYNFPFEIRIFKLLEKIYHSVNSAYWKYKSKKDI
jgi:anaerobic magnesium-protoporphyrin IX monomethyl ester cyclase